MDKEHSPLNREILTCRRCVLDAKDDPNLSVDAQGVCNHCHSYTRRQRLFVLSGEEGKKEIEATAAKISAEGRRKPYDCVAGISGGVDSTYTVYLAKQLGLRPLVVHFDNGWNSELAVKNIENIVNRLGFDLYTYVVDWEEFKDLQLAYLKASVIDIEVPTDHGLLATLYRTAQKQGLRHLIMGSNIATEGTMPPDWVWFKMDLLNLQDIHRKFGTRKLQTFPTLGFWRKLYCQQILRFETVEPLNKLPYVKSEAKQLLTEKLGWRDYGGKHCESVFTRFYQGFILPKKFGVDKRKAHLSCLILSGQISREDALLELRSEPYDPKLLKEDREFVLKKLDLSESEFSAILAAPARSHLEYASYVTRNYRTHDQMIKALRPILTFRRRILGKKLKEGY